MLKDGDETLLRKGLFVWRVLLEGSEAGKGAERSEALEKEGVVGMVVDVLESCLASGPSGEEEETGKWDMVDLGVRLLAAYVETCGDGKGFKEGDRERVKGLLECIAQSNGAEGVIEKKALERVWRGIGRD